MSSGITPKEAALATTVVLGILVLLAGVYRFREFVFLLVIAIAVVAAARAVSMKLEAAGMGAGVKRGLVVGFAVLFLAGAGVVVTMGIGSELAPAVAHMGRTFRDGLAAWARGSRLERAVASALAAIPATIARGASEPGSRMAVAATTQAFGIMVSAVVVMVLALYWSSYRGQTAQLVLKLIPVPLRATARRLGSDIELGVGLHIVKEIAESSLLTLILSLAFRAIGLPFATVAAAAVGTLRLVPMAGLPIGITIVVFFCAGRSPLLAVVAILLTLLCALVCNRLVTRVLAVRDYHQVVVILCLLLLFRFIGWTGLLLAPPLAAALQIAAEAALRLRRERAIAGGLHGASPRDNIPQDLDEVRTRVLALQTRIGTAPRPVGRPTLNAFARLRYLLARIDEDRGGSGAVGPAGRRDDGATAGGHVGDLG